VLCAGRVYCDLVFSGIERLPTLGTEVFADELSLHGGGGAWITAAWLAGLGRPASVCATLPAPPFDALLRIEAERSGVSLAHSCTARSKEPQLTIAMVAGGDRAFLSRRPGPGLPDDPVTALTGSGSTHLHISELATLLEYPELPSAARRAGLSVSLDCGWDEAALNRDDLATHLQHIDVFLPNEAEHAALAPAALARLPLVVIKRGAAGATVLTNGECLEASTEALEPLDTTGAGDAFDAGFLHAWLDGLPLPDALALGNRCGARAVMQRGGGCRR